MSKNIKITIEGRENEPVVLENVERFNLMASLKDSKFSDLCCSDVYFSGFVAAKTQCNFMEALKEGKDNE